MEMDNGSNRPSRSLGRALYLCSLVLECVRAVPDRPSVFYLDLVSLVTDHCRIKESVPEHDWPALELAIKELPSCLTRPQGGGVQWWNIVNYLFLGGAIRIADPNGRQLLSLGEQFEENLRTLPAVSTAFIQHAQPIAEWLDEEMVEYRLGGGYEAFTTL